MNSDDIEKQLQRRPLRTIPAEWRAQILSSAARQTDHASRLTLHAPRFSVLRELFWPSPYAWAGLAAVWLAVLALNFVARDTTSSHIAAAKPVRQSPETLLAAGQHLRLRAELTAAAEPEEPAKPLMNRPRSARQAESVAV